LRRCENNGKLENIFLFVTAYLMRPATVFLCTYHCNVNVIIIVSILYLYADLRKADTGWYTCKAVSETGETSWSAGLLVETPTNPSIIFHRTPEPSTFPGPPTKPTISDIGETSVRLSWRANPSHGASPVHSYTVEYVSHETGEVVSPVLCINRINWRRNIGTSRLLQSLNSNSFCKFSEHFSLLLHIHWQIIITQAVFTYERWANNTF